MSFGLCDLRQFSTPQLSFNYVNTILKSVICCRPTFSFTLTLLHNTQNHLYNRWEELMKGRILVGPKMGNSSINGYLIPSKTLSKAVQSLLAWKGFFCTYIFIWIVLSMFAVYLICIKFPLHCCVSASQKKFQIKWFCGESALNSIVYRNNDRSTSVQTFPLQLHLMFLLGEVVYVLLTMFQ